MTVGIGDDAAVVEPERNKLDVLTVDAIVEGVHFDRRFTPPDAIGHRALAVNLSDLAAMGAAPRASLLSLALPATLPVDDFDAMLDGFTALAAQSTTSMWRAETSPARPVRWSWTSLPSAPSNGAAC